MLMRLYKELCSFLYVKIKFKKQNLELTTKVQVEVSHTTLLCFPSALLCSAIHFFPSFSVFFWSCNYPFFALPTWVYHFLLTCIRWHQTSQLCCPCENYEILRLCGLNCDHGFSMLQYVAGLLHCVTPKCSSLFLLQWQYENLQLVDLHVNGDKVELDLSKFSDSCTFSLPPSFSALFFHQCFKC